MLYQLFCADIEVEGAGLATTAYVQFCWGDVAVCGGFFDCQCQFQMHWHLLCFEVHATTSFIFPKPLAYQTKAPETRYRNASGPTIP